MKNGKYRVLLVEDQTIPTQLFEHFIQTSERYELARSIECAAFAEVYCMTGEIDIVLMDVVTADGASGLDAAEKIKKKYPNIKEKLSRRTEGLSSPTSSRASFAARMSRWRSFRPIKAAIPCWISCSATRCQRNSS